MALKERACKIRYLALQPFLIMKTHTEYHTPKLLVSCESDYIRKWQITTPCLQPQVDEPPREHGDGLRRQRLRKRRQRNRCGPLSRIGRREIQPEWFRAVSRFKADLKIREEILWRMTSEPFTISSKSPILISRYILPKSLFNSKDAAFGHFVVQCQIGFHSCS